MISMRYNHLFGIRISWTPEIGAMLSTERPMGVYESGMESLRGRGYTLSIGFCPSEEKLSMLSILDIQGCHTP